MAQSDAQSIEDLSARQIQQELNRRLSKPSVIIAPDIILFASMSVCLSLALIGYDTLIWLSCAGFAAVTLLLTVMWRLLSHIQGQNQIIRRMHMSAEVVARLAKTIIPDA